jgi:hypothetical protein
MRTLLHDLLLCGSLSLLHTHLDPIVRFIPRLEGMGIHKHNSTLHQGLGTDQFIIGCIVDNVQNTNLTSANFGTPREVTGVETEGAEFTVATASADDVNAFFTDFGHGGGSAHLELALFAELGATASRFAAFVLSFACDSLLERKRSGD